MRIIALFGTLVLSAISQAQPISTKEWDRQNMMQVPEGQVEARESNGEAELLLAGEPQKAYLLWNAGTDKEYSLALKEFNLGADYDLVLGACDGCDAFEVLMTHRYEGFEKRVEVRVMGLGEYRIRFL